MLLRGKFLSFFFIFLTLLLDTLFMFQMVKSLDKQLQIRIVGDRHDSQGMLAQDSFHILTKAIKE